MEIKKYEVGKFYRISIAGFSGLVTIPAMCVKRLKRKLFFKYIIRHEDGKLHYCITERWIQNIRIDDSERCATSVYLWTNTSNCASEVAKKPEKWDKAI